MRTSTLLSFILAAAATSVAAAPTHGSRDVDGGLEKRDVASPAYSRDVADNDGDDDDDDAVARRQLSIDHTDGSGVFVDGVRKPLDSFKRSLAIDHADGSGLFVDGFKQPLDHFKRDEVARYIASDVRRAVAMYAGGPADKRGKPVAMYKRGGAVAMYAGAPVDKRGPPPWGRIGLAGAPVGRRSPDDTDDDADDDLD